jgi:hypothetical protein
MISDNITTLSVDDEDIPRAIGFNNQFPSLMAAAITKQDLHQWAAARDIALIREQ